MPNYAKLAATAKRLVDGAGRTVTLIALDYDVDDPTKPWLGPVDPRATPAKTLQVKAAFVSLGAGLGFSKQAIDLSKKATASCLVGSTEDLSIYQELLDGQDRYKITYVEALQPGDVRLMSALVLNQ